MTAAEILDYTRRGIRDQKTLPIRVTSEIVSSTLAVTGDSEDYNLYYTEFMPITSGSSSDAYFLGGRWDYEIADAGNDGERWIQFISESGSFMLDSGATQVTNGNTVTIGYVYDERQAYTYRDSELNFWIKDSALWANTATCDTTSFSVVGSVYNLTFAISPNPSTYLGILIAKRAQLEIRRAEQAEADTRGIKVKQGPIEIDTTRGGQTRSANVRDLEAEVQTMVDNIIIGAVDGNRIDLYSTLDSNIYDQGAYHSTYDRQDDVMKG